MNPATAKIFIFASESNAGTDLMLEVANYDDRFPQVCKAAIRNWQSTNEDYVSFMRNRLHLDGYRITDIRNINEQIA